MWRRIHILYLRCTGSIGGGELSINGLLFPLDSFKRRRGRRMATWPQAAGQRGSRKRVCENFVAYSSVFIWKAEGGRDWQVTAYFPFHKTHSECWRVAYPSNNSCRNLKMRMARGERREYGSWHVSIEKDQHIGLEINKIEGTKWQHHQPILRPKFVSWHHRHHQLRQRLTSPLISVCARNCQHRLHPVALLLLALPRTTMKKTMKKMMNWMPQILVGRPMMSPLASLSQSLWKVHPSALAIAATVAIVTADQTATHVLIVASVTALHLI